LYYLIHRSVQDEGLVGRRHVAHLEEEALSAAQVFLDLVLVETAKLLKIRKHKPVTLIMN
jgi:hypothetical protein